MSAMSVYIDVVLVRALIATGLVFAISLAGMLGVVMIRLVTSLAIPGWATVVFGDLLIILVQTAIVTVAMTLMVLASRSTRPIVPLTDSPIFVGGTVNVMQRASATSERTDHG
jgi:polyisoprenyl-phosphate glycosyltransferase